MRRLIDFLPSNNSDGVPEWPSFDDIGRLDMSLDTLIPDNPNKPYDMKELILKVVDEGDFFEISEAFAKNIVTGFGRIAGRTVGFVANQPMVLAGVLDSDASRKAARFVRFCDAFNVPIVTFVDVPGFLPGTAQEYGGLIKHGAKLLFAYSQCTVPLVTIITRKAYGGAFDVASDRSRVGDAAGQACRDANEEARQFAVVRIMSSIVMSGDDETAPVIPGHAPARTWGLELTISGFRIQPGACHRRRKAPTR